MSANISSTQERSFQARNNVRATLTALLAIISRDLLVMRREALTFLVQMLVQPLFFLFVFGKVLPTIGAASAGFSSLLLPGIVAFTVFITTLQGPSVELARDLGFTREIEDRLLAPLPIALVLTPLIFTGCAYYPWASLSAIKWFQILTLFNPLTYAAEGMRYAMIPPIPGQAAQTLAISWVVLALCAAFILSLWGGIKLFHRRVVS